MITASPEPGRKDQMGSKIISVKTFCLKLASADPYLGSAPSGSGQNQYFVRPPWRSLYSRRYETLLVRLEADDGHIGWGEALAPVAPEVPQAVIDRMLAPHLVGTDPTAPRPATARLAGLMRERGHLTGHQADALAACDIALWDLAGNIAGLPVARLLGGAFRSLLPTYVSGLPRPTDEERADLAREWVTKGFRRVKLALGHGVDQDLATFDAIASGCPDLAISIDAHWAYTLPEAERLGQELDRRHAWFLEAPLVPEDADGHRRLAKRIMTPVAVGETLRNRFEFAGWLGQRALDLCQPDVARTGITEAVAAAALAEARHVRVAPHHSVGLGVALAAGLQFAAAIENFEVFEFQPTTLPLANRILVSPVELAGSSFSLPEGPGLGVVVDEQAIHELSETS
jgi:D-galactarolactone cycloisomerase